MINIDGTHLYGKYQGVLMIAMTTDANNKVLPFAFAIVDNKSGLSWRWFLEYLRISIGHVIPDEGICIISDRYKGIKCAIEVMTEAYGYFTDITFDMLLATSTHTLMTRL